VADALARRSARAADQSAGVVQHAGAVAEGESGIGWPAPPLPERGGLGWPEDARDEAGTAPADVVSTGETTPRVVRRGWRRLFGASRAA
jgi:hypothetical protein